VRPQAEDYEQRLLSPLRRLIAEAQKAGVFRDDIPDGWLTRALVDLVVSAAASEPALGRDDAVAAAAGLFLDGVRSTRADRVAITRTRRKT
jgi:hypothetical protein